MYRILRELGFRDFSLMEKFFAIGKIGSLEMNDFASMPVLCAGEHIEKDAAMEEDTCDSYGDMITQAEIDALLDGRIEDDREVIFSIDYKKWHWLKMIVSWMIEKRSEEIATKHLINYSMNKSSIWLNDLTRIVRNNFNDLPSDILEILLDNGYTREVYDIIVKEYVVRKYVSL